MKTRETMIAALFALATPAYADGTKFELLPEIANVSAADAMRLYRTAPWQRHESGAGSCIGDRAGMYVDHLVIRLFQLAAPGAKLPGAGLGPDMDIITAPPVPRVPGKHERGA